MATMRRKKRWSELTERERTVVLVVGSIELALTATALAELATSSREQVRGSKALWALGCFVQPVGPIAFLLWGRRRQ